MFIQAETRPALSAMFNNWLAGIELHAFQNVRHETGGNLIGVHCHAIGFGVGSRSRATANLKAATRRFASRFPDTESVKVDWIGPTDLDLWRAVSYVWKAPHRCKTLYLNADKGRANLHESEANDRYVRYLRMVEILSMMRVDRMVFGANQGASMRADALREAASWLRTGERDRRPPIHSNGIPNYWVDLWQRLGEPRFKLPLIKYKKQ